MKKVYDYFSLYIRRVSNEKVIFFHKLFEPEFLKRKTEFLLTTKCYINKYD